MCSRQTKTHTADKPDRQNIILKRFIHARTLFLIRFPGIYLRDDAVIRMYVYT